MKDLNRNVDYLAIRLRNMVKAEVESEFAKKRLSGNLVNTMVSRVSSHSAFLEIPARKYSFRKFFLDGAIVYTGGGYAEELDEYGSHLTVWYKTKEGKTHYKRVEPGNHKGFVSKSVLAGVRSFVRTCLYDYEVEVKVI